MKLKNPSHDSLKKADGFRISKSNFTSRAPSREHFASTIRVVESLVDEGGVYKKKPPIASEGYLGNLASTTMKSGIKITYRTGLESNHGKESTTGWFADLHTLMQTELSVSNKPEPSISATTDAKLAQNPVMPSRTVVSQPLGVNQPQGHKRTKTFGETAREWSENQEVANTGYQAKAVFPRAKGAENFLHAQCNQFLRNQRSPGGLGVLECENLLILLQKFADLLPSLLVQPYLNLVSLWKDATFIGSLELLAPCSSIPTLEAFAKHVIASQANSQGTLLIKHVYQRTIPFLQEILSQCAAKEYSLQEQILTLRQEIDSFDMERITTNWQEKVDSEKSLTKAAQDSEARVLEKLKENSKEVELYKQYSRHAREDLDMERKAHEEVQNQLISAVEKSRILQDQVNVLKETVEQLESVRQKQKFEFLTLQNKASQMAGSLKGLARNISAYLEDNKLLRKKLERVEKRHNMGFHDMTPRPNYREIFNRRGFKHYKENFTLKIMQQHFSSADIIEELVDHIKGLESKQIIVSKQAVENPPPPVKQAKSKTGGSRLNDISLSIDHQNNSSMFKSFRMSKKKSDNIIGGLISLDKTFKSVQTQTDPPGGILAKEPGSKRTEPSLSPVVGPIRSLANQKSGGADSNSDGLKPTGKSKAILEGDTETVAAPKPKSTRFDTVLNKLNTKKSDEEVQKQAGGSNAGGNRQHQGRGSILIKLNQVGQQTEEPSPIGTSMGFEGTNSELKSPESHLRKGFQKIGLEYSDSKESFIAPNRDHSNDSGVSKLSDENYEFIRAIQDDMQGINEGFERLLKMG